MSDLARGRVSSSRLAKPGRLLGQKLILSLNLFQFFIQIQRTVSRLAGA